MTVDEFSTPTTWPELLAHLRAIPNSHSQNFLLYFRDLLSKEVNDPRFGAPFFGAASSLTRGSIMGYGPHMARSVEELHKRVAQISSAEDQDLNYLSNTNLAALAVLGLRECGGWGEPSGQHIAPLNRLAAHPPEPDDTGRQAAWALMAWGQNDGLSTLLFQDPTANLPGEIKSGDSVRNIQIHMARCIAQGADPEVALPAWQEYLASFPLHLSVDLATWPELLWAARAMHVVLSGEPANGTLDWLMAQIV